jgi:hypothetical protein
MNRTEALLTLAKALQDISEKLSKMEESSVEESASASPANKAEWEESASSPSASASASPAVKADKKWNQVNPDPNKGYTGKPQKKPGYTGTEQPRKPKWGEKAYDPNNKDNKGWKKP